MKIGSKHISTFVLATALSLVACSDDGANTPSVDAGSITDLGTLDASTADASVAIDATVAVDATTSDATVAVDATITDASVAIDAAELDAAGPDAATALPSVCPTSLVALPSWFIANAESNVCGFSSMAMSFIVSNPSSYTVTGAQAWVVKQIGTDDPVFDESDGDVSATATVVPGTGSYTINLSVDFTDLDSCEIDARRFLVVRITTNETGTASPDQTPLYEVSSTSCSLPVSI